MYSGNYRSKNLDYHSPGIFMITLLKKDYVPPFSRIVYNPKYSELYKKASAFYFDLGQVIRRSLKEWQDSNSKLKICQSIIMPNHIHIVLQISDHLDKPLGNQIAILKRLAFLKACEEGVINYEFKSLFKTGFNDQFMKANRSLKSVIDYVRLNPYRLWIKKTDPKFYRMNMRYDISGYECRTYGNTSLLSNPFITPVVMHRSYSPKQRTIVIDQWRYAIHNDGVLISPFVAPLEKEILKEAIKNEGKIIWLKEIPESERWKPSGVLFDLCRKGRLLFINPKMLDEIYRENFGKELDNKKFRQRCVLLNSIAEKIAGL